MVSQLRRRPVSVRCVRFIVVQQPLKLFQTETMFQALGGPRETDTSRVVSLTVQVCAGINREPRFPVQGETQTLNPFSSCRPTFHPGGRIRSNNMVITVHAFRCVQTVLLQNSRADFKKL